LGDDAGAANAAADNDDEYFWESVAEKLDQLYEYTKTDPAIYELYELAAAKLMSTSTDIGMTVLLSYDYFHEFSRCIHEKYSHVDGNVSEDTLRAIKVLLTDGKEKEV
jgi:hypothetical protein